MREHVRAIRGERELEQRAGKGVARLDEREEAAGGEVEPLQRAADVADDLAHQPVIAMRVERSIDIEDGLRIARCAQENRADLRLVQPQPQKRIVELAKRPQRPRLIAGLLERVRRVGLRTVGGADRELADPLRAIDRAAHVSILNGVAVNGRIERCQRDPGTGCGPIGFGRHRRRAFGHGALKLTARHDFVDKAPFDGALAAHAFGQRAERIGEIAAHLALVDDARETAGSRQHAEERRFRQRHRGIAIVHQVDLIARERELVAAAGADAVERGEELDAARSAHVFHPEPRLVGELAEVHLEAVAGRAEHEDVGAGAEDARLQAGDDDGVDLGVLEAQPLQRVGKLDVDAEIVRVELELVVGGTEAGILLDVHGQRRDRAVDRELPVLVAIRRGFEGQRGRGRLESVLHAASLHQFKRAFKSVV